MYQIYHQLLDHMARIMIGDRIDNLDQMLQLSPTLKKWISYRLKPIEYLK